MGRSDSLSLNNVEPQLQFSILCESVTVDQLGRPVFTGGFSGYRVSALPANVSFVISNQWTNGVGFFSQHTEVTGPEGAAVAATVETDFYLVSKSRSHRVDERFKITLFEAGLHTVRVLLRNDLKLEYHFSVETTGSPSATIPTDLPNL